MTRLDKSKARDRRISRMLWLDWAKQWVLPVVLLAGLAGAYVLTGAASDREVALLQGTVTSASWNAERHVAKQSSMLVVHLDDGRDVSFQALLDHPKRPGERVAVSEHARLIGPHNFRLHRE